MKKFYIFKKFKIHLILEYNIEFSFFYNLFKRNQIFSKSYQSIKEY